jgi:Bacterial type II and III secretion system protein
MVTIRLLVMGLLGIALLAPLGAPASASPVPNSTTNDPAGASANAKRRVLFEAFYLDVPLAGHKSAGLRHPLKGGPDTGVCQAETDLLRRMNALSVTNLPATSKDERSALTPKFSHVATFGASLKSLMNVLTNGSPARIVLVQRVDTPGGGVGAEFPVNHIKDWQERFQFSSGSTFGGPEMIEKLEKYVEKLPIPDKWMRMTPVVQSGGMIRMDIHTGDLMFVSIANVGDRPLYTWGEAGVSILVPDRGTIMLGGLINAVKTPRLAGVPILRHIPILKSLFGTRTRWSETVVLAQTTVISQTLLMSSWRN